tara:strand:- start:32993 stop:33673 length:681 start_codon:yes stop_codon:yes gene_type:complete
MDEIVKPRALITDGSAGIGLEIAKLLAEYGHDLIITGSSARVQDAADSLRTLGADVLAVRSDLSRQDGVREVVQAVRGAGPLDVMVLNAGIAVGGAFLDIALERHLQLLDLNIGSTVRLCHALVPELIETRGKILMVSSISALGPYALRPMKASMALRRPSCRRSTLVFAKTCATPGSASRCCIPVPPRPNCTTAPAWMQPTLVTTAGRTIRCWSPVRGSRRCGTA